MELRIEPVTFPEVINFNFEEIEAEVLSSIIPYKNMVVVEEQLQPAKKDLATLRKLKKALSDEKISFKKEYLKPFEEFEEKIKRIISIIDEGICNIDEQVKDYEEQRKQTKLEEILNIYNNSNAPEWLKIELIFNEKWLNASVKISTVEAEINARLEQIAKDIELLQELPEFAFEAEEVYKSSLDINRAISEGKRLADIQQRKAEAERIAAERKVEAEKAAAERATAPSEEVSEPEPQPEIPQEAEKFEVSFTALLTIEQAKELKQFFISRNIAYKAI